ncbi:hypothetical protein MCUN1_001514 [Malassezia cuniculi]|uniref:CN hydrolase domain-containing protein n=1 Tax=Malassezia cuniculi TaxID=948313 RepID=A0AAF0EXZ0_9BASI|nr:hypothetical protein MCUN1_001514 [Malassezia cuniculi]
MCLSGYMFDSLRDIEPYLEAPNSGQGPTLALAREISTKHGAYVAAGFAQRGDDVKEPERPPRDMRSHVDDPKAAAHRARVHGKAFNAAMLVAPDGSLVKIFRKHFLYEADTTWSDEGPGFEYVDTPLGRMCVAICMDMNPYCMYAPFEGFELATFCREESVDVLVVCTAWLHPDSDEAAPVVCDKPSSAMLWYWAVRLSPMHGRDARTVICNRIGKERTTLFGGSSAVFVHTPDGVRVAGATGEGTPTALELEC